MRQGSKTRLHGPEAGVIWTTRAAMAYGADFVLECEGVTREDDQIAIAV
jgi:hypothetical protein